MGQYGLRCDEDDAEGESVGQGEGVEVAGVRLDPLFELSVRTRLRFVAETVAVEGVEKQQQSADDDSRSGTATVLNVDDEGEDELLRADQQRRELPLPQSRSRVGLQSRAPFEPFEDGVDEEESGADDCGQKADNEFVVEVGEEVG